MEIVVKIADYDREWIANGYYIPDEINEKIAEAIIDGTPLPKGHGRLIEEPTETDISNTVGGNNDFAKCIRDSVKAVFDNAVTIIDADMNNGSEDK